MKHLITAIFFYTMLTLNAQTLYIQNGATVYVNGNNTSSTVLQVAGNIQNEGTLTDVGQIKTTQDFTNNGTLNIILSGTTLGTGYNQILANGTAIIGGTLNVSLNNYTPANGANFTLIDAATLTGSFTFSNLPTLSSSSGWSTGYNGSQGTIILSVLGTILPVELLNLTATPINNTQIELNWLTSLEQNTRDFTVERSIDGQHFDPLSTTAAKGVHSVYQFIDDKPLLGLNYYRLTINDFDNKKTFSKIVSAVISKGDKRINVYPTLFNDFIIVDTEGSLEIVNVVGQVIFFEKHHVKGASIPTSDLPSGMYVVRVRVGNDIVSEKVVKP